MHKGQGKRQIGRYIGEISEALRALDARCIERVLDTLESAYREGRAVFLVGNGGSAANASHFAQDLAKGTLESATEKRFRVLSLTDNVPFLTAVANDLGYENVFVFQLRQFARSGDVLIAISGSGNSPNVLKAAEWARANSVEVIGFTGFDGGKLGPLADVHANVPLMDMCQSEAVHSVLMHMIVDLLRKRLAE